MAATQVLQPRRRGNLILVEISAGVLLEIASQ